MKRQYVVSFNPIIEADVNRICAGRDPDEDDISWIKKARAVILPNGCSSSLYFAALKYCSSVFPNYLCRFLFPGKTGQIRMFRHYGIKHPKSMLFSAVAYCHRSFWNQLRYPLVVKTSHGGEGEGVFLVSTMEEFEIVLSGLKDMERAGFGGFLMQEYIPNDGRDLRVVVMGDRFYCYWKIAPEGNFLHNISRGSHVDEVVDPEKREKGIALVKEVKKLTGIDLAAFDIIFHKDDDFGELPYILEVNYFFGRAGLGGNERYYELLSDTVKEWLKSHH